ncbi:MAG: RNA polymerase-binding protein DksA [Nitrospirota bacterium]|nr:RNA polymerase-binding protein DksA [Nitrospirota bacterium]
MDSRILAIKKKLEAQRQEILTEAEHAITTDLKPERENFPDLSDQATAESDRGFLIRLRGREQMLLKKVDEAIQRIEDGTFGICEGCGEKIPIKRLEARPVTTLCIECKTKQEEDEKLRE